MIGENNYLWYILCLFKRKKIFSIPQLPELPELQVSETTHGGQWEKTFDKPLRPSKTMMQLSIEEIQN